MNQQPIVNEQQRKSVAIVVVCMLVVGAVYAYEWWTKPPARKNPLQGMVLRQPTTNYNGQGFVPPQQPVPQRCPNCNGQGRLSCSGCGGSKGHSTYASSGYGKHQVSRYTWHDCRMCLGSGDGNYCSACNGKGVR